MRLFILMVILISGYCASLSAENTAPLTVTVGETYVDIQEGDAPVLQYKYRQVPRKPYVMSWFTRAGINILRDAPHDHLHHHGLMHAIMVDEVNFWEESESGGYQEHRGFIGARVDKGLAAFTETLVWRGPDSPEALLVEQRSVVHHGLVDAPVRVLTWHSILETPEHKESVTLGGRIYHGVGMRFPEFMDKVGEFRFAGDVTGGFEDGPHYLAQAAWCAYTVAHPDHPVTVAMFSAPDNPRPALWFTMREPFAYLSGTLDLSRGPIVLESGAPIIVKYGVAAWDGEVDDETVQALYEKWVRMTHSPD